MSVKIKKSKIAKRVLIVVALWLLLILALIPVFTDFRYGNIPYTLPYFGKASLSRSFDNMPNKILFGDATRVNKLFDLIPEKYTSEFLNDGGTVSFQFKIDNDDIADDNGSIFTSASGSYDPATKQISLEMTAKESTLLHEFGHYVDELLDYPSRTDNFLATMKNDMDRFERVESVFVLSTYPINVYHNTGDTGEYFAESFMLFILHPDYLQLVAPETYCYFTDLL